MTTYWPTASLFLMLILGLTTSSLAQKSTDKTKKVSINNPKRLVKSNSVLFKEITRSFRADKFYGLQKRYQSIDGIVMFGIVNKDEEVLLQGPKNWAPPGGAVQPDEDWAAAARRIAQNETGNKITVDKPVLVEKMNFQLKNNSATHFSAYILHLRASPATNQWELSDEASTTFQWFNNVPANAHPSHERHIKLYLSHSSVE